MKNILLFGGSGFVGMKLVELKPDDVTLTATYNKTETKTEAAHWEACDLLQSSKTEKLLKKVKPEVIINASKAESKAIEPIVAYAKKTNTRLVHISTDAVFDGVLGNYKENDATQPITAYGKGKLEEEQMIKESLADYLIVRTSYVYGKSGGEWDKRTKNLLISKRFSAFTNMFRTPILVDELAKKLWKLALGDAKGIVHVAGKRMSMPEFFYMLAGLAGVEVEIEEKECIDNEIPLDTSLVNTEE